MTPYEWLSRALAENERGQPAMFLEIHDCGGVVLWKRDRHTKIRMCACPDTRPTYDDSAELVVLHGLAVIADRIGPPDHRIGAGRYG